MKKTLLGLTLTLLVSMSSFANVNATGFADDRRASRERSKCHKVFTHNMTNKITEDIFDEYITEAKDRGEIRDCGTVLEYSILKNKFTSEFRYYYKCSESKELIAEFSSKCHSSGVGTWEMKNLRIVKTLDYSTK